LITNFSSSPLLSPYNSLVSVLTADRNHFHHYNKIN
jgi:hypothetical protein